MVSLLTAWAGPRSLCCQPGDGHFLFLIETSAEGSSLRFRLFRRKRLEVSVDGPHRHLKISLTLVKFFLQLVLLLLTQYAELHEPYVIDRGKAIILTPILSGRHDCCARVGCSGRTWSLSRQGDQQPRDPV